MKQGIFIISLDFELNWGVHDVFPLERYGENLLGAREAIPRMLELFQRFDIHATWATVGMLYFENKKELLIVFQHSNQAIQIVIFHHIQNWMHVGENEGTRSISFWIIFN